MKIYFKAGAVLASAAASLALGLAPASAAAKPDATPQCAGYCVNLFNEQQGSQYILSTGGVYSSAVTIQHASNAAFAEDFHAYVAGTLGKFIWAGLISKSSYSAISYPWSSPVFEAQYSPYGVNSGLCAAVKGTAKNGSLVLLRDCGAAARSLWVADVANEVTDPHSTLGFDAPLVNASDKSFSQPLVLTYEGVGAQLKVTEEGGLIGTVPDSQEWGLTNVA